MEEFLSFVTIDFWEMLFTWGNLLILVLLMKKFLFKPVKNILDKREKEIAASYENAQKATDDAAALKADYENKLSSAKNEAAELIGSATKKATITQEQIVKDAHEEADRIIKRAEAQIELEKQNAIEEAKNEISEIAVTLASKIIEKEISEEDHREMIDDFIKVAEKKD